MQARRFTQTIFGIVLAGACLAIPVHRVDAAMKYGQPIKSAHQEVARGKYLVVFGSCTDCHTPGAFFGKPDMAKFLGGSDVGFAIPGVGVFVGANLTPDKKTGLGSWTEQQIVAALTTGKTPDGRTLAPVMPWHAYASLTKSDALAIAAYLKSLPPVDHQVGGPYGPNDTPKEFVMAVIPPAVYMSLPKPGEQPAAAPAAAAPSAAAPPASAK